MKYWIVLLLLVVGLAGCLPGPSVCDEKDAGPSLLCQAAADQGVKLEDVGLGLRLASTVAMANGLYTPADVVKVLTEIRSVVSNPVSYIMLRTAIDASLSEYPGMFEETTWLLNDMMGDTLIYPRDREIILNYIDKRIAVLEPG